jgi:hypothetical protein
MITVAICTRDPEILRLMRVCEALRKQSLPSAEWNLLVVDNGSQTPLRDRLDVGWHSRAAFVDESTPGLTPARLAAIDASTGDLVFVDDDNLLRPNYLEAASMILRDVPWVGAFGGSVELEFGVSPPAWTEMFHGLLAARRVDRDMWSNLYVGNPALPCGAGMVVRREVAEAYRMLVEKDPRRQAMDRKGQSLVSDGDTDLALTACDLGLGCGQFAQLTLRHVIPSSRFELEYLERLAHGMAYSGVCLRALREETRHEVKTPGRWEKLRSLGQDFRLNGPQRRVRRAWARGREAALADVRTQWGI